MARRNRSISSTKTCRFGADDKRQNGGRSGERPRFGLVEIHLYNKKVLASCRGAMLAPPTTRKNFLVVKTIMHQAF